jgi:hypothetical protein
MSWAIVIQTVVTVLGSAGVLKIGEGLLRRKAVRVEVADKVNEMTVEWAAAVRAQADAADMRAESARKEADSAWDKAREANQRMSELLTQIEMATARLRRWRVSILSPEATLDALRAMVNADTDEAIFNNGRYGA